MNLPYYIQKPIKIDYLKAIPPLGTLSTEQGKYTTFKKMLQIMIEESKYVKCNPSLDPAILIPRWIEFNLLALFSPIQAIPKICLVRGIYIHAFY